MSISPDRYATLWEALPGLVWGSGTDSLCNYFNARWLEFTGRSLEEELGNGWVRGVHPDDKERRMDLYRHSFASRKAFRIEYRLRHKEGDYRWITDEGTPVFNAAGEFTGFLGCCLALAEPETGRENGEGDNRRSGTKSSTASQGAFRTGPDGRCHYIDEWWTSATGMEPEESLGAGWLQALHPDDYEAAREKFQTSFRQREAFTIECRLVNRDGEVTNVVFQGHPVVDEGGVLTGCEATVSSLAERKPPRKQAPRTSKVEALNVLAGSIAHDFNNQLTPILLNLSMAQSQLEMESGEIIEEVRHRLQESEDAALRAKTLANRLLAFGQGGNPVKQILSLKGLTEDAVRETLAGTNSTANFSIPDDLWLANIDPDHFKEVIAGLVTNAVEAMPAGGNVHVSACNLSKVDQPKLANLKGPHICLRVEDEGNGVRFDITERIFDPYFSTKRQGAGLGLPTAQAIIRNHGGDIILDNDSGLGATFLIYLPVAPSDSAKDASMAKIGDRGRGPGKGKGRVLIMDDEALVRSSLSAMLKAYGYEVETANDGAEAIEKYTQARDGNNPIDCALMDLTIHGGMGGKEAIGRLTKIDPDATAVVCSGYSNDLIMDNFRNYGFKGAIQKPFHPDQLNRLLQELIPS